MVIRALILLVFFAGAAGCSTESTRGAAEGAAKGSVVGAVGGMVTALVFGGDVGDAAAMGAVWGGSTGAVSGGMQGAAQGKQKQAAAQQRMNQQLAELRRKIGDDAFSGLEALAQCKHKVAIAYAESAQQSGRSDYVLAGYWLEVMAVGESQGESAAVAMLPDLVKRDPKLNSTAQADTLVREVMVDLRQARTQYGLKATCG